MSLYVQYGCGLSAPEGWVNFDASPTLRFQRIPLLGRAFGSLAGPHFPENVRYGDIVKGLPLEKGSCTGIYCSHVLEHLALDDFRIAIRNTHSYLAVGGVFRSITPDLECLAREYLASTDSDASLRFMTATYLGRQSRPRSLGQFLRAYIGNSSHLWMWDQKSLARELSNAGFSRIRRAVFDDYSDPAFAQVQDTDRWQGSIGVECSKST